MRKVGTNTDDSFEQLMILSLLNLDDIPEDDIMIIRSYRKPLKSQWKYDGMHRIEEYEGPYVAVDFKEFDVSILSYLEQNELFLNSEVLESGGMRIRYKYPEDIR